MLSGVSVTNTDGPTISLLHLQRSSRQIQEPVACKNECVTPIPRFTVDGRRAVDLHRALTDPERAWQPGSSVLCQRPVYRCLTYLSHLYLAADCWTYCFFRGSTVAVSTCCTCNEQRNGEETPGAELHQAKLLTNTQFTSEEVQKVLQEVLVLVLVNLVHH